jgi:hypothetical protein
MELRAIPALTASEKKSMTDPGPEFWQQLPKRVMAQIPLQHRAQFHWPHWLSIALPTGTLVAGAVAILLFGFYLPQNPSNLHTPPTTVRIELPMPLEVEMAPPTLGDLLDELDKVTLGRVANIFDAEFSKTFLNDLSAADPVEEIELLDEPGLREVARSLGLKENI